MTERIDWRAEPVAAPDFDLREPRSIRRLLKRKERLSAKFQRRERKRGLHGTVKKRTMMRARLYKTDLRLEHAGFFDKPNAQASQGASLWTPDGYIAAFAKMPGANANYRGGRNLCRGGAIHVTVGVNSTPIGLRGYFLVLLPKVWPPEMYAPFDAVTWHACEHNPYLLGIETEKYDWDHEPTTDDQIMGMAYFIAALREKGIAPFDYFMCDHCVEPGRYGVHTYIPHNSLRQYHCDQHHSFLPPEDMARAHALSFTISGSAPPPTMEDDDMGEIVFTNTDRRRWFVRAGVRSQVPGTTADHDPVAPYAACLQQLIDLNFVPKPVDLAATLGRWVREDTLAMWTEQPWDWTSLNP